MTAAYPHYLVRRPRGRSTFTAKPRQRQRPEFTRFIHFLHDGAKSIATLAILYWIAAGWHTLIERLLP